MYLFVRLFVLEVGYEGGNTFGSTSDINGEQAVLSELHPIAFFCCCSKYETEIYPRKVNKSNDHKHPLFLWEVTQFGKKKCDEC